MIMNKKSKDLHKMPCSSLIQLFAEAAAANIRAWEDANPQLANKAYDVQANVYRELRSRGIEAQRALLSLLNDPEPYVRCSAAAYALEFAPQDAEPVLQALRPLRGFVGHDAGMTLDVWRKGELRFP
jgi:hypothetical protein